MPRYHRTSQAERDLIEIWQFIADDTPDAADRTLDRIDAACEQLSTHPGLGRERSELGEDIRSYPVGSYLIFYKRTSDGVAILRILHGARNIPEIFEN